ncbi:hypothetical protein NM688_g309 [Phlebia brevispora]|uniref:Uncharacterized protein n=1 Tax=Phlebia brevispora TaxID=194682 RepID=A0ACC1TEW4_9APHY|nr:hypothetical protein NM688_g309 [Phlebia brevispora]
MHYHLPDTLRHWPWKADVNPYYQAAKAESVAWIESFKPFSPEAQTSFNKCDFSLLAACTYVKSNFYNLRSCCDAMHVFFVLDEYTDQLNAEGTKVLCDASMNAILHPDRARPHDDSIIGEICRQFWQRARRGAPKCAQERFVSSWQKYLVSLIQQAERRAQSYICTIDEYLAARYQNIGVIPSIALLEICLEVDIPHEVLEHPAITALTKYTTHLVTIANDMCSYKREVLSNNAAYNAITVFMVHDATDISGAFQRVSDLHDKLAKQFLDTRADVLAHRNGVPSWGSQLDHDVNAYIDGLGMWVRGNDEWHFKSARYFGDEGTVIQKTRKVIMA